MNTAWERDLSDCRATLASDPNAALDRVNRLLKAACTSSERLRAMLTLARVQMLRGDEDLCRETLEKAGRYRRVGPVAQSELEGRRAQLALYELDVSAAATHADRAVALAQPLALATQSSRSRQYKASVVVPQAAYAAALITRAEVRLNQGAARAALSDAVAALSWADPRFVPYVHVAGITALGRILIEPGVGTVETAHEVLKLCRRAHQVLAARRIKAGDPHRVKIRGLQALALGMLGSLQRAEDLMFRTIRELEAAGLAHDARLVVQHMVWLVGNRAGQVGRARLLATRYGLPMAPISRPRKPKPKDDTDPIGF